MSLVLNNQSQIVYLGEIFISVYSLFLCVSYPIFRAVTYFFLHFSGNNAKSAMKILQESGLPIIVASDFNDAAKKVVEALPKS